MTPAAAAAGRPRIIVLLGPTAAGKSELGMNLAERFAGEIVSADSMQVYRHMDIGTAKPTREERRRIPHHLIDVVDPDEAFSAAVFAEKASAVIEELYRLGRTIFLVGGTGLYIKALLRGLVETPGSDDSLRSRCREHVRLYGKISLHDRLREADPQAAARIHPSDVVRVIRALEVFELTGRSISEIRGRHAFATCRYETLKIGLSVERKELLDRIDRRTDWMIERGLIEEVRELLRKGYGADLKPMSSLGYKHIVRHLQGSCTLAEAVQMTKRDTRRYAKRQMTWFGADSEIRWRSGADVERLSGEIGGFLSE